MILFSADHHIKLEQKNVPVEWAVNRYNMMFQEFSRLEDSCSLHIVGGDFFDRVPNPEELALYFLFVHRCKVPTIIFDGNHEATKKNKTFFTALKDVTNNLNPLVEVVDEIKEYDTFTILPYCELHKKGSIESLNKSKPVFTHVRGEIPPHVKPEVDLDRFQDFPVVYAGDLHAHSNSQRNIVYPGSPVTTSFHRSRVTTGVLLIDEKDLTAWQWLKLDLPQLIRKTVSFESDMIRTDFDHTIYELEGDMTELSQVKDSDLLDKKVVQRQTEASLILDNEYTIEQELEEYLKYILELPQSKIDKIMETFNDYSRKIEMG